MRERILSWCMLALAVLLWVVPGAPAEQEKEVRVIAGFESSREVSLFGTKSARLTWTRQSGAATQGQGALKITLQPGGRFPGIHSSPWRGFPQDWRGYDALCLDLYNPSSETIPLLVRIDDARSHDYGSRHNMDSWGLRPGHGLLYIPLSNLKTEDRSRLLDLGDIREFYLFSEEVNRPTEFYLDHVRLVRHQDNLPEEILWLDFGDLKTPLWPGFEAVGPDAQFGEKSRWGFSGAEEKLVVKDMQVPGPLARDCVSGNVWGDYQHTFKIRLRDGSYRIWLIARHVSSVNIPMRSGSVQTEGRQVVSVPMSRSGFYSRRGLFRYLDRPYRLDQDAWDKFFSPDLDWHTFEVEVTGGVLDLDISNLALFAMVISPSAAAEKTSLALQEIDLARREHFYKTAYYEQRQVAPGFTPDATDQARGYAVWPVPWWEEVFPWSRPEALPGGDIHLVASPGEDEPFTLAVLPLKEKLDLRPYVTELRSEKDVVLPGSLVSIRQVQYREKRKAKGVYVPSESFMIPQELGMSWQKDLAQRLWLTLSVPEATPAGVYRGAVILGRAENAFRAPLEIEVLPVALPAESHIPIGWYYESPASLNYHYDRVPGVPEAQWRNRLAAEMRDLRAHCCNTVQFPPPRILEVSPRGEVKFDFSRWEVYLEVARQSGLTVDHPGQSFIIEIAQRLKKAGLKEGTKSFHSAWRAAVQQLADWSQSRGLQLVYWVVDEPREHLLNPWNRTLRQTLDLLRALDPVEDIRLTVSPMADTHAGVDYTPLVGHMDILQTHAWSRSRKLIRRAKSKDVPWWIYNAGSDRLSFGFYPWATRADGRWQWHYAFWSDPGNIFVQGWGVTFPSPLGPLPVPEYERTREGIEDLRWLEALEARIDQQPEHPAALSGRQLLLSIRGEIPRFLDYTLSVGTESGKAYQGRLSGKMPGWREQIQRTLVLFEEN